MSSLNRISPKKSDLKLPQGTKKSPSTKNQDGRDNIIGMASPSKHIVPHASSWTKSVFKNDFIDAKSALLQQKQPKKSSPVKRKITKEPEKGKLKPNVKLESTSVSDDATPEDETKCKSIFPKTTASYVCKYCCRRFRTIELLREHTSTHGNKPSYVCYLCGTEAGAFSSLMAHFVKHSRTKSILKTNKLKRKNCDLQDFVQSSSKSPIRCSHCKLSFSSTEKLASHFCSVVEQKSQYHCAYCGQVSSSIDDYRLHVLSHSVTPFLCMHCNFKGPTKKLLDKHIEVCKKRPKLPNENIKFKCTICSTQCKHKKELNQHTKVCKQASECKTPFKSCSNCNSEFINEDDLNNHALSCSLEKNSAPENQELSEHHSDLDEEKKQTDSFLCSHCGEIFYDQTEHENHQVTCFEDELSLNEKTSSLCQTCGNLFASSSIKAHQKECLKSEKKSTKDFDKETAESDADSPSKRRSARLVRRKSSFSDESPKSKDSPKKRKLSFQESKEDITPNKFMTKGIIKVKGRRGRQSKVGNADFKCNYCDLTFCSKSTLLRHKRMHSGNPYFSCKYCGKFFFRKDVYTRHEVNVHSKSTNEAFCCYYCKLYFEDPSTLKEHVLVTHKENAFLPVKTEFIGDINQDAILSPFEIKKEPSSSEIKANNTFFDKSTNSRNDVLNLSPSTPLKKCGICSQTFQSVSEIEKHLQSHKQIDMSEPSTTFQDEKECQSKPKSRHIIANTDLLPLDDSNKVNTSSPAVVHLNNSMCNQSNQSKKSCTQLPECSADGKVDKETDSTETKRYICKLCLNIYSSESSLTSHENTEHKMIDWYQCLVCNTSGPKQDMIEHMFSHMYRVGTVVISNSSNNLDSILPFTQALHNNENIASKQTNVQIENDSDVEIMLDEISEQDLPLLIDYGSNLPCISKNTSNFAIDDSCQEQAQCSSNDNYKKKKYDNTKTCFEMNSTNCQKTLQNKNIDSENKNIQSVIASSSNQSKDLTSDESQKTILVESSNPVCSNVLESSLEEKTELPKKFLNKTLKIQNVTSSSHLYPESSNYVNTNLLKTSLIDVDSEPPAKKSMRMHGDTSLSPKCLSSPKKLLVESPNPTHTNSLKSSLTSSNSELSTQSLKEALKIQNAVSLSPKPLLNLASPKKIHSESSHQVNTNLFKSSSAGQNQEVPQQCLKDSLKVQNSVLQLGSTKDFFGESSNYVNQNLLKSSLPEENWELPKQFSKDTLTTQNTNFSEPKVLSIEDEARQTEDMNTSCRNLDDCASSNPNFSQLRYLLENFKKTDSTDADECSSKRSDEPNYQLHILEDDEPFTDLYDKNDTLSWLNSLQCDKQKESETAVSKPFEEVQKSLDRMGVQSTSKTTNTSTLFTKVSLKGDFFPKGLLNSSGNNLLQESNQNANTCLKFDINQSRSIFSENEIFQTSQIQNKIFDFSDLIGDSINLNNTIFQGDQVPTEPANSSYNHNTSLHTKNSSSNSIKSIFPSNHNKCNNCNTKFNDINEVAMHICSKNSNLPSSINSTFNLEPKYPFLPSSSRTNSPGILDYEKNPTDKFSVLDNISDIFSSNNAGSVNSKIQSSHFGNEQINNSFSNNTCNTCFRTFCDAKELANHSVNCSRSTWCKSDNVSDQLKFPETLHSLLAKKERITQQCNYSISAENDTSYDTVLNLSKNPFNS